MTEPIRIEVELKANPELLLALHQIRCAIQALAETARVSPAPVPPQEPAISVDGPERPAETAALTSAAVPASGDIRAAADVPPAWATTKRQRILDRALRGHHRGDSIMYMLRHEEGPTLPSWEAVKAFGLSRLGQSPINNLTIGDIQ